MVSCVGQEPAGFQEEGASSEGYCTTTGYTEGYTTPHSVGTPHQVPHIIPNIKQINIYLDIKITVLQKTEKIFRYQNHSIANNRQIFKYQGHFIANNRQIFQEKICALHRGCAVSTNIKYQPKRIEFKKHCTKD